MEYIGEHVLPGKIGHVAVLIGFVSGLIAAISYFFATQKRNEQKAHLSWLKMARWSFFTHSMAIFTLIGILFFIMINKYYEYQYVQQHVNDELDLRYIFAAFWEGQEGSFLLWMFWHIILGFAVMRSTKEWEMPIMSILSLVQVFIVSMILGIYFRVGGWEWKMGSNPTLLLRDVIDAPIFSQPDYASKIRGNGLNPLLQNYWMTIHPPTLFLGFASTTIPFCFAVAALWLRRHTDWLKMVLPWALFSGAILGTGILMGGAWAYEALSFGGYWAWDPVENMSLVPWLILIAGLHTNVIANATGNAIKSTYLYYIFSFILVLYSTFLTRSGILGDSSVHAFTELGLEWQLVAFVGVFKLMGLVLFILRFREIPTIEKEEATFSREFWMFIGSLVLLFSSILITFTTSIPVYNKVSEALGMPLNRAMPNDPVAHYNKYQLWIGVFIGLFSGIAQFLRYKELNWASYSRKFLTHIGISALVAAALTVLTAQWITIVAWQYWLLLFFGLFAAITNFDYLIFYVKGNLKTAGSALAHLGFGIMIVGIMASSLNKEFISKNLMVQEGLFGSAEEARKNIILYKGQPMFMSGYEVTYANDTLWNHTREFWVNYKKLDENGKPTNESFQLRPYILYDRDFTKVASSNPATKHYAHKDIFTHISSLPAVEIDAKAAQMREDTLKYAHYEAGVGDTIFTKKSYAIIEDISQNPRHKDYKPESGDLAVGIKLAIRDLESDKTWYANPVAVLRKDLIYYYPVPVNDLNMRVRLPEKVFPAVFGNEEEMLYNDFKLKKGETIKFNGWEIRFNEFNRTPKHPRFQAQAGDIAVGAKLQATHLKTGETHNVEPIFFIRNNQPFNIKDELAQAGLHFRFQNIDPSTETVVLGVAQSASKAQKIPIEIAENAVRSDYIVLQAIVFPGINLFWLGSSLMMLGLGLSWWNRKSMV